MTDSANVVYGRLKEAMYLSGHAFGRGGEWLETLLAADAWRTVGPGFSDINEFLRSIDLSPFALSERPALVRRIKELQPEASNRAIASAAGVNEKTVRNDLRPPADYSAPELDELPSDLEEQEVAADYSAPELALASDGSDGSDTWLDEPGEEPEPEPEPAKPVAHVGRNSGDNEWYTPAEYIKAATAVMGEIDLDPASSEAANAVVGAARFYAEADDGLAQPWNGRVWMNPPYAQPWVDRFCTRVAREFAAGAIAEACVLVNNGTETNWFQEVAAQAAAICFPRGRVKFWHPSKEAAPLQGQAVLYLGPNPAAFRAEFLRFGFVVVR